MLESDLDAGERELRREALAPAPRHDRPSDLDFVGSLDDSVLQAAAADHRTGGAVAQQPQAEAMLAPMGCCELELLGAGARRRWPAGWRERRRDQRVAEQRPQLGGVLGSQRFAAQPRRVEAAEISVAHRTLAFSAQRALGALAPVRFAASGSTPASPSRQTGSRSCRSRAGAPCWGRSRGLPRGARRSDSGSRSA